MKIELTMKAAKRAHRRARRAGLQMTFKAWAREHVSRRVATGKLLRIVAGR